MREVGSVETKELSELFRDYLFNRGIESDVEQESSGRWSIWIIDEDRLDEAGRLFEAFARDPLDPSFVEGAKGAEAARSEQERTERSLERRLSARKAFAFLGAGGRGVATLSLVLLSVIVTLATSFGQNLPLVQKLSIAESFTMAGQSGYFANLAEVRSGQVWRLFTPLFMHFGIIHLFFNLMWLLDLGNLTERIRGSSFLILFVLVVGGASNVAQYYVSGPGFGGMSGVVYGLLGYVWMHSKFNPWSDFVLHRTTVQMMMVWLVLGFTGLIGNIANICHLGGLIGGVVWGFIEARRAMR